MTIAAAPSEMDEEAAAVTVPSLRNTGLSAGIFSMSSAKGVSSCDRTCSPLRVFRVTGAISATKSPSRTARCARRTDSVAKASCMARVKPYLSAVFSAKHPIAWPSHGLVRPSWNMWSISSPLPMR